MSREKGLKRIGARVVCPNCKRTFKNLARHKQTCESSEQKKEREAHERANAEGEFVAVLRRAGNIVEPEVLVPNQDGRKWRVDYLIVQSVEHNGSCSSCGCPDLDAYFHQGRHLSGVIALEIQGFGFGHVGRAGWLRDIEKAQAIAANRWLYVPVTREQVANGEALEALARCGVKVCATSGASTLGVSGS